jgi:thioredoxin 1
MIDVTTASYDEFIKRNGLIVFHLHADWCAPCKRLLPVLEEIESLYKAVTFVKVDVDAEKDLPQILGITAIPAMIFMKDQKVLERRLGKQTRAEIVDAIEQYREKAVQGESSA